MKAPRWLDLGWSGAGQVLSAAGAVVGVRILTQSVDPATYGLTSLALGMAALVLNMACTPFTQAAMFLHPSLESTFPGLLRGMLDRLLMRLLPWLAVVTLAMAAWYAWWFSGSPWLVIATALLLTCDAVRSIRLALLNAAGEQRRYGAWSALEAWARPMLAAAAATLIAPTPEAIILSYVAVTAMLNLIMSPAVARAPPVRDPGIDRRMWSYALPLIPLGLVGWANGVSDRYIIGAVATLHDAGIYAAVYGLASRPLLLVGTSIELALRPLYQRAVSGNDRTRARRLLRAWLAGLAAANVLAVGTIGWFATDIARLLLGPAFREGAVLMPWIAAGYGLLSLAYVFERVCYAHAHTRSVLAIQSITAVAAAITTWMGLKQFGLIGAAYAVPMYFGVQLIASMLFGACSERRSQRTQAPTRPISVETQFSAE